MPSSLLLPLLQHLIFSYRCSTWERKQKTRETAAPELLDGGKYLPPRPNGTDAHVLEVLHGEQREHILIHHVDFEQLLEVRHNILIMEVTYIARKFQPSLTAPIG